MSEIKYNHDELSKLSIADLMALLNKGFDNISKIKKIINDDNYPLSGHEGKYSNMLIKQNEIYGKELTKRLEKIFPNYPKI